MEKTAEALRKVFKKLTEGKHFEKNSLLQMMTSIYILDVEIGISQAPERNNLEGTIIIYFKKEFSEESDIFGGFTPSITISALKDEKLSFSTRPYGLEVSYCNIESLRRHLLVNAEIIRLIKEEL